MSLCGRLSVFPSDWVCCFAEVAEPISLSVTSGRSHPAFRSFFTYVRAASWTFLGERLTVAQPTEILAFQNPASLIPCPHASFPIEKKQGYFRAWDMSSGCSCCDGGNFLSRGMPSNITSVAIPMRFTSLGSVTRRGRYGR